MNGSIKKEGTGSVALAPLVQDFFEDFGRRGGVGMPLLVKALGELVDDVDGLLVGDVRAAFDDVVLPLRDARLSVAAEILADHEVSALVLLGGHDSIVARRRMETSRSCRREP